MLFSEPKIPQLSARFIVAPTKIGFSALQRAENSSIEQRQQRRIAGQMFQCSSASRKFLNNALCVASLPTRRFQCSSASRKFLNFMRPHEVLFCHGFSALQRAENSSMSHIPFLFAYWDKFQCSSASRKFLNRVPAAGTT